MKKRLVKKAFKQAVSGKQTRIKLRGKKLNRLYYVALTAGRLIKLATEAKDIMGAVAYTIAAAMTKQDFLNVMAEK